MEMSGIENWPEDLPCVNYEAALDYKDLFYIRTDPGLIVHSTLIYMRGDVKLEGIGPCPRGYQRAYEIGAVHDGVYSLYIIDFDDLVRPNLICKFKGLDKTPEKKYVNDIFLQLLSESSRDTPIYALDEGATTRRLQASGFTDITVINPTLRNLAGAVLYKTWLYEFLRDVDVPSGHFALDYCCMYRGSICLPKSDLKLLFSSGALLHEGGTLWLSFNMRHLSVKKRIHHLESVRDDVVRIARRYGYTLKYQQGGVYRRNSMIYLFFKTLPAGIEPATPRLTVECSNHLSYGSIFIPC